MFKEALVTVLCFIAIYIIFRILLQKKERLAKQLLAGLLALTLLLNIGYNVHAFFPAFVLDGVNYLGDASGNLFIYNEGSEFPDQILFPVLQNRTVLIDESADFYALFFNTFAKKTTNVSLTADEHASLISARDQLSFSDRFRLVSLANYAFPKYAEISEIPMLYLDEDALSGADTLIAVADTGGNLYLFAQSTYQEVTEHE